VTTICNQPEAFASDLGENRSRYLFMCVEMWQWLSLAYSERPGSDSNEARRRNAKPNKIAFQSKADHTHVFSYARVTLTMHVTLIYELDLDILKMHLCANNEVCSSRRCKSNVRAITGQTDTQTDAIENITTPHLRVVKIARERNCTSRKRASVCWWMLNGDSLYRILLKLNQICWSYLKM